MENIFITPHVSGYVEDNSRLVEIFAKNYQKFHAGEELDYLIDFERGF
jgi:phosphoglycerate dehydrogenase-like enzyme